MANYLPKRIDMKGQRFGRLTVLSYSSTRGERAYWLCVCDCGNETIVSRSNLRTGSIVSCGCKQSEDRLKQRKANKKTK